MKKTNKNKSKKIKHTRRKRLHKLVGKGSVNSFFNLDKKKYKINFGQDYNENEDEELTKLYMISENIEDINKPDLILFDGKYYGEVKDNKRNGEGVMKYTDGNEYIGHWENNKKNGFGAMFWGENENYIPNNNPFITEPKIYIGEFNDNQITGKGKLKYMNGFTYIGDFKNGFKNGYGLYYNKKIHFIGDFIDNDFKKGFIYKREVEEMHGEPFYFTSAMYLQNGDVRDAILESNMVWNLDTMVYYI